MNEIDRNEKKEIHLHKFINNPLITELQELIEIKNKYAITRFLFLNFRNGKLILDYLETLKNNAVVWNCIALIYTNGLGIKKNYNIGFSFFEKAYQLEEKIAISNLAVCYLYGTGVTVNIEYGISLLKHE